MIDYSHLNSLTELLGKSTIKNIYLDYVDNSTEELSTLFTAWNERSYIEIQAISHSLRSASLNMAMTSFAEQCQVIEISAPQHNDQAIQKEIQTLSGVHQASIKQLADYFLD